MKTANSAHAGPRSPRTSSKPLYKRQNGDKPTVTDRDPVADLPKIRVTLVMPKPLDTNVELFCHVSGKKKLDVVSAAIADFLVANGVVDPYRDQTATIDQLLKGRL